MDEMPIYYYSPFDGSYIGAGTTSEDPSDSSKYLFSGCATLIKPPEISDGQTAIFKDKIWILKDRIDGTQSNKKELIDYICSGKINAGFYSAVEQLKDSSGNVQKLLYKCDITHQIDFAYYINTLIPAHKQGLMTDTSCMWKDASIEGPCHSISDKTAMFLYTEMGLHVQWCRTAADDLKAQVNAATTVDEVNAVAFSDEPDLDGKTMALLGITSMNDLEEGNVI